MPLCEIVTKCNRLASWTWIWNIPHLFVVLLLFPLSKRNLHPCAGKPEVLWILRDPVMKLGWDVSVRSPDSSYAFKRRSSFPPGGVQLLLHQDTWQASSGSSDFTCFRHSDLFYSGLTLSSLLLPWPTLSTGINTVSFDQIQRITEINGSEVTEGMKILLQLSARISEPYKRPRKGNARPRNMKNLPGRLGLRVDSLWWRRIRRHFQDKRVEKHFTSVSSPWTHHSLHTAPKTLSDSELPGFLKKQHPSTAPLPVWLVSVYLQLLYYVWWSPRQSGSECHMSLGGCFVPQILMHVWLAYSCRYGSGSAHRQALIMIKVSK